MPRVFKDTITDLDELRAIVGHPADRVVEKVKSRLDIHSRGFVELASFVVIASVDPNGGLDVSPKGDPPGFVQVLDDETIVIPDRKGNRRADTFGNVIFNPNVGLFFFVPGYRETLRVGGTAEIVRDADILDGMAINGSAPELALAVHVNRVLFHCAKCVIRSGIWQPESWPDSSDLPSLGRILKDQTHGHESAEELDVQIADSYANRLY